MENQRKVGLTMRILTNQLRRKIENEIAAQLPGEVTFWQGRVLGYIRKHSQDRDVFQKDIEQAFDIRRSTATGILQLLEKNELLIREPCVHDARMKKITLTPKALEIHDVIVTEIDRVENQLASLLTEEELHTFFAITDKITAAISSKNEGGCANI